MTKISLFFSSLVVQTLSLFLASNFICTKNAFNTHFESQFSAPIFSITFHKLINQLMGNQWLKCLDFTPWRVWMVDESAKILLVQFYNPEIISYSCYFPIYPFPKRGKSNPNHSLKIRTASAIFWIYLGIFRDYSLNNIFFRNKFFLFFKIENWNFQNLFEIRCHKTSTHSFHSDICYFLLFYRLSDWLKFCDVSQNSFSNRKFWLFIV